MLRAAAVTLLLALCAAASQAARLPPNMFKVRWQGCSNFTAITDTHPELEAVIKLVQNLDLLPAGIPDDFVLFLPSNTSLTEVLVGGPIPTPSSDLQVILARPLIPEIAYRLNAILLYHMAPIGAATAQELEEEGSVPTVLGGDHFLTFTNGSAAGSYTLTDATGRQATVRGPFNRCASSIFVIDKVMLPAEPFVDIPLVTESEALCLLTGLGCRVPALSVSSPALEEAPALAPAPGP